MKYIVDFTETATAADIEAYLLEYATSSVELNKMGKVYIVECNSTPPPTAITETIIDDLYAPIKLLNYEHIFVDKVCRNTTIESSNPADWWKVASINTLAHTGDVESVPVYGTGTNVYILDSGINEAHPEFSNTSINNIYSITSDFADSTGHGTALGSVIAGKSCGLTNATLCIVKIFDNSVPTHQSHLLSAFDAIVTHHLSTGAKLAIANISWSIDRNLYIESKIRAMAEQGIFVVCSAGNSGVAITDVTPAGMNDVLTIGSYTEELVPADFSNYSSGSLSVTTAPVNTGALNGWAPGTNIRVALMNGDYGFVSGTSISAAIQSAAMAYNMVFVTDNDNVIQTCHTNKSNMLSYASYYSLAREGLLFLSGIYGSSINKVTTYGKPNNAAYISPGAAGKFVVGQEACLWLFSSESVKRVTSTDVTDLPFGLTISNGLLRGTVQPIPGTSSYVEINLMLTLLDNAVVPFILKIGILSELVDPGLAIPGEDPVMDIILALPQNCGPYNGTFPNYNCINATDCISPCENLGTPKAPSCACL